MNRADVSLCTVIIATGTLLTQTGSAATDPLVYDNYASGFQALAVPSVHETSIPYQFQHADDFTLSSSSFITGITWHGDADTYDPTALDFRILFYADNGGVPTGGGLADPSTTALASFEISAADITVTPSGSGNEQYTADLGGTFEANAGTTYWVSVAPHVEAFVGGPWWYWNVSNDLTGNDAVAGHPSLGVPFWTAPAGLLPGVNGPVDAAFKLHGTAVPAPAALALLGFAAMCRRRSRCRNAQSMS